MTSIVLADDQALVRDGFRAMLEAEGDLRVVAEAPNGAEAVEAARRTRADVAVMDIRMPEMDGIEATRRIVAEGLATRVLVVTTFDLDEYVFAALRAGAAGFLLKEARPAELVNAVRTVASGDALLAPNVTRRLIEHHVRAPEASLPGSSAEPTPELTERELDVLRAIARGLSNKQIGEELFISDKTVKSYVTRLLSALGLASRSQIVVYAYESGLVRPGENAELADPTLRDAVAR
jgi:DNA-binding NarL/FixJ family response regulator